MKKKGKMGWFNFSFWTLDNVTLLLVVLFCVCLYIYLDSGHIIFVTINIMKCIIINDV